jgi:putative addiction module component (TIGR02574 family)
MSDADVAEILNWPAEEKLRLVELLWESLSGTPSAVPLGDAHRAAIDEALAEHRQNPDDVITLEQAVAEVRGRR